MLAHPLLLDANPDTLLQIWTRLSPMPLRNVGGIGTLLRI
jgi:hypothetical protein